MRPFSACTIWEAEVRRVGGHGWTAEYPTSSSHGVVARRRARFMHVVQQMKKVRGEMQTIMASGGCSKVEKGKLEDAETSGETESNTLNYAEGSQAEVETKEHMTMADLNVFADRASASGFVEFV